MGGLLAVQRHSPAASPGTYFPTYDGNGNVSEYLNTTGAIVAHYEYGPFGEALAVAIPGGLEALFKHRFSTKPLDAETGYYYYGYRLYDPLSGRWLNRDPIGERGGLNLYAIIGNDTINIFDYLGLVPVNFFYDEDPTRAPIKPRKMMDWRTLGNTRASMASVSCSCDCDNSVVCQVDIKFEIALNTENREVSENPNPAINHEMKHIMSLTYRMKKAVVDKLKISSPPKSANYDECLANATKLENYGNSLVPFDANGFPKGFDDHDQTNNIWAPVRGKGYPYPPDAGEVGFWNWNMRR